MKRFLYSFLSLFLAVVSSISLCLAQSEVEGGENGYGSDWNLNNPISVLDSVKSKANKHKSDQVQNTKLDYISSKGCLQVAQGSMSNATISNTLCYIKSNIGSYLQYLVYVGLSVATIFLIWNGFKLVTASDRSKQIGEFKKNLTYIIIGVVLLVGFYYIIELFTSVVNYLTD